MAQIGRWEDFGNGSLQYIATGYLGLLMNNPSTNKWEWTITDLSGRNGNMPRGSEDKSLDEVKVIMEDAMKQIVETGAYVPPTIIVPLPESVTPATNLDNTEDNVKTKKSKKAKKDNVHQVKEVILESLSLRELMETNKDIASRIPTQFKGMPEAMQKLCLDYIVEKGNGYTEISNMIMDEVKKIIPKANGSDDKEAIVFSMFSAENLKIKWRTLAEIKGEQKADIARHINMMEGTDKIGSYGVNFLGEEPYKDPSNKDYLAIVLGSKFEDKFSSGNIDNLIDMKKGSISINIDLPLSIIAGRLSYEYMLKIIKFAYDKYNSTYDFKFALRKYIEVNKKKQSQVYEKDMQAAQNEITEYQTNLADAISRYCYSKNQFEVASKIGINEDEIMTNLDRVRNSGICSDIYYEKEHIVAILPNIKVQFKGKEYAFGDFNLKINLANGTVLALGDGKHSKNGLFHPHVQSSGSCCLGNYQKIISEFVLNGDFAAAISLMLEFLVNYNEANPFSKIENWESTKIEATTNSALVSATAAN